MSIFSSDLSYSAMEFFSCLFSEALGTEQNGNGQSGHLIGEV